MHTRFGTNRCNTTFVLVHLYFFLYYTVVQSSMEGQIILSYYDVVKLSV